jgi:hypothetical protein
MVGQDLSAGGRCKVRSVVDVDGGRDGGRCGWWQRWWQMWMKDVLGPDVVDCGPLEVEYEPVVGVGCGSFT